MPERNQTQIPNDGEARRKLDELRCCVIIPTFNNAGTLASVIEDVLRYSSTVIVVNDGSTDQTASILEHTPGIISCSFESNQGKGRALQMGFHMAAERGFRYAITIDSDGQHKASDIPRFAELIESHPDSLIVGARNMDDPSVPGSSRFGHRFSIFWFWIETGQKIEDVQTGYRLYPLEHLKTLKRFYTGKYEFEVEVLVRLAWKGVRILSLPTEVYYAPAGIRVSHFRKGPDFTRTSILNAILVFIALLWVRPFMFIKDLRQKSIKSFIREYVVNSSDSNTLLSLSVTLGVFIGVLPVWGWQMILAFALAHYLGLNKFIMIAAANISIPPFLPFILYGSYQAGGWITGAGSVPFAQASGFSFQWIKANLLQYLLGSLIFGLILAFILGILTWIILAIFRKPIPR